MSAPTIALRYSPEGCTILSPVVDTVADDTGIQVTFVALIRIAFIPLRVLSNVGFCSRRIACSEKFFRVLP